MNSPPPPRELCRRRNTAHGRHHGTAITPPTPPPPPCQYRQYRGTGTSGPNGRGNHALETTVHARDDPHSTLPQRNSRGTELPHSTPPPFAEITQRPSPDAHFRTVPRAPFGARSRHGPQPGPRASGGAERKAQRRQQPKSTRVGRAADRYVPVIGRQQPERDAECATPHLSPPLAAGRRAPGTGSVRRIREHTGAARPRPVAFARTHGGDATADHLVSTHPPQKTSHPGRARASAPANEERAPTCATRRPHEATRSNRHYRQVNSELSASRVADAFSPVDRDRQSSLAFTQYQPLLF